MLDEINQLKTEPIDAQEISGVTGLFLTNYYLGQETDAAQAAELAKYELTGGGWHNSFEFFEPRQTGHACRRAARRAKIYDEFALCRSRQSAEH